eukprot:scaffold12929_cov50-Attheya_sp.AAC.2
MQITTGGTEEEKEDNDDQTGKPDYSNMSKEEIQAKLHERGEGMVDVPNRQVSNIHVEFNLKNNTSNFDVCSALAKVFTEMKKVDKTASDSSKYSTKPWDISAELPHVKEFQMSIPTHATHPPRTSSKVTVYITLHIAEQFNMIKHEGNMMKFLKQNKVWIKVDTFPDEASSQSRISYVSPSKPSANGHLS